MRARIKQLLSPPVFDDEERVRLARSAHIIALTSLMALFAAAVIMLIVHRPIIAGLLLTGAGLMVIAFWLTRRGRLQSAMTLILLSILGIVTGVLYAGQGVHDVGAVVYPIVIIMASLLLKRRSVVLIAVLSILSVGFVTLSELNGLVRMALPGATGWDDFAGMAAILIVTAIVGWIMADDVLRSLAQARHELTERTRAEEALRVSEARYRQAIEAAGAVPYHQDYRADIYTFMGDGIRDLIGYAPDELTPTTWDSITEEIVFLGEVAGLPKEEAIRRARAGEFKTWKCDMRVRTRDGKIRWLADSSIEVLDERGASHGSVGILQDITDRKQADEALRASEDRFRSLVQNASDIITINAPDGRVVYETPSAARILGYGPNGLIGRNPLELIHPDDIPVVSQALSEVIQKSNPGIPTEYRFRRADGMWIHLESVGTNLLDQRGIHGIVLTSRDISERKRTEQRLAASEQRYRDFVEQSTEGIWLLEFDQPISIDLPAEEQVRLIQQHGYVAECNAVLAKMYGYSTPAELSGRRLLELYGGEPDPQNFQATLALVKAGYRSGNRETREVNSQGELVYFMNNAVGIIKDGNLVGLWGTQRDVTSLKKAEMALAHERDLLQALMDNIPDTIYFKDTASRFTRINRAQARLLSVPTPDAAIGKTDFDFQSDELSKMFFEEERQLLKTGQPVLDRIEYNPTPAGQPRWLSATKAPIRDAAGRIIGLVGVSRDITERRLAEEREQTITRGLRAVIEAADELMRCDDLDSVYRRAVELAREKLGLERCGLFLLDAAQEYLVGTYGTDDQRRTTDEHIGRLSIRNHPEIFTPSDRPWLSYPSEHTHWEGDQHVVVGSGWVASTVIRNRDQPIGIFYNDTAISHLPLDDAIQETMAVYCSLLGNIIERKRTEEELRFSEDKFSKAFRTSPDAISITRLDDGRYLEVNEGFTTLMGYTPDEACGKSSLELNVWVDPHDRASMAEGVREQDEVTDLEVPFRHKSGQIWIGLMSARLIEVNGEHCILSVTRDITARKQAEEAVRQSAERLATLHEIDQAILLAKSIDEIAHAAVSRIQRLVPSWSAHVALFDGAEAIVTVAYCDGCRALTGERIPWEALGLPESFKRGQVHVVDDLGSLATPSAAEQQMSADGARAYLKAPMIVMGELIGYLSLDSTAPRAFQTEQIEIAREVADELAIAIQQTRLLEQTQRHAAELELRVAERTRELAAANERLTELDQLKSKFVSDVSHELRTPIANLKLYADLLERGKPEKHEQYISVLRQQSKRLAQLVDDILNLSRLEMGKDRIAFGPVDLNHLIDQVVTAHQPRTEAASLTLTFEPHIDLPPVRGEVNQLAQVITNLISNALNYTPHGCVRVATALLDDRVCLQVEDTGMGIDAADLANIFDRFYRGRRPQKSDIPGTGLGLAIVKEIVDLHQGHIEVDSRVNRGTTFRVWLPLYV